MTDDTNAAGPPPLVANYRCGSCTAEPTVTQDTDGMWHSTVTHDDTCPVHTGTVNPNRDLLRAALGDKWADRIFP